MSFDKAKNFVKFLLAVCVIFCVAGVVTAGESMISVYLSLISVVCLVLSFIIVKLYCKCRYCGKAIFIGLFNAKNCPHCRRNLVTGAKTKSKGGRR